MTSRQKRELRARLETDGRWGEFVALRERLKHEGVVPREAWRQAEADLAAEPAVAEEADEAEAEAELEEFTGETGGPVNLRRDVEWVYQHLTVKGVKAKDAPSAGAWGLLKHYRRPMHTAAFYTDFVVKLLPSKAALAEDAGNRQDDGRKEIKLALELAGLKDVWGTIKPKRLERTEDRGSQAGGAGA
ncbi:MAG: hypothetical protein NTW87_14080 [Planctomycetota bacterium]|nr:hypothetical protein [Planctomycetota bacterium]